MPNASARPVAALLALLASTAAFAAAPLATTTPATGITNSSAVLNGTGTPNGEATTGWFRLDTVNPGTCNDTFGTRVPATSGTDLGTGSTAVPYSITTTGLVSGTTYYFCSIVNNASGTAFGTILSFTVPGAPITLTVGATGVTATAAVLNGSANPIAAATAGYFRISAANPGTCNDTFGTRVPSSGGTALGSGTASVDYAQSTGGLLPGNTYYFCAIASNAYGTSFGSVLMFTAPALAPSTSTSSATGTSTTSTTLNGSANPNGDSTTGWFRYSAAYQSSCNDTFGTRAPATGGTSLGSGNASVAFSQPLTGLLPGTTYYFCAIAQNSLGTTFGAVYSFTTAAAPPTVTTLAATSVAAFSATLNASANPDGGATTGWFRYSTTNPGTCNDTFGVRLPSSGGTGLGSGNSVVTYSQTVLGLAPTATYYFCAIVQNSAGTAFGAVLSFTTPPGAPAVTTASATSVGGTSATLNGSANPNGDATTGWFRYSTTSPGSCNDTFGTRLPATGGDAVGSGLTAVAYSEALSGLAMGTTYYYCAIAQNPEGTSFGNVLAFVTFAPPAVTTTAAFSVGNTTATLNGYANPNRDATTGWFRYDTVNPGSCDDIFGTRAPATGGTSLGNGTTNITYTQPLTGLLPRTTYYYCAIAQNPEGTSSGAVMQFTTYDQPTVTTLPATAVASTYATLNSSVNPNGNGTYAYFRYGTTDPGTCNGTFGTATTSSYLGAGWTALSSASMVTSLLPGQTYYFCAIAYNGYGTSYGAVLNFTAPASAPAAWTGGATSVIDTAAVLNGQGLPNGAATTGWFRYSTTSPGTCNNTFGTRVPATGGTDLGSGNTWANYSQAISSLTAGTTYYFCAIVQNSVSTSFGGIVLFTTPTAPTVTTTAAAGVTNTSATLTGSGNPDLAATTGWFRISATNPGTCDDTFGSRVPTSGGSSLGSGSTAMSYSQWVSSLSPGTTYYYCAIDSNAYGTAFGAVLSFTTPTSPAVTTLAATGITWNSAVLNGSANPDGASSNGWFRFSTTNPGTCNDSFGTRAPWSGGSALGGGSTSVSYSYTYVGLSPATTYYYCALASNTYGTSFGAVLSFTTPPGAPIVSTNAATIVDAVTATLKGSANPEGDATTGWFRISTVSPGTCSDTFGTRVPATGGTDLGSGIASVAFSQTITGLATGATYYYCAIAQNPEGLSFGSLLIFVPAAAPLVTTVAASGITSSAATLNSSINPDGNDTYAYFRYATTDPGTCNTTFGNATSSNWVGAGAAAVSNPATLSGLPPGTTYYYCAIAYNSYGTTLGAVLTFTTAPNPPQAWTGGATSLTATSAVLNGQGVAGGAPTTGWFRISTTSPGTCNDTFGTRVPATGGSALGSGNTWVNYSQTASGLTSNTTYYYCAITQNSVNTAFGAVQSFTTPTAPTATTVSVTSIDGSSAVLNGSGNPNGAATTGWFRISTTNPGTCNDTFGTASTPQSLGSGTTAMSYSYTWTTLSPGTTYYFCAIVSNAYGTAFGAVLSFTTASAPAVTTSAATSVTSSAATMNGSAVPNLLATTGWFRYSTTNPGICNDTFGTRAPWSGGTSLGAGTAAVPYTYGLTGLLPGNTYYFCAIAQNGVATSFGAVLTFTTLPLIPAVTTSGVSGVTNTTATLSGSANPNGGATTGYFRYDTASPGGCNDTFGTRAPATGGSLLGAGNSSVPFSQALSGLLPATTYYYCAIGTNSVGTGFGSLMSFTTLAAPVVMTLAATPVTATTATLNASVTPEGSATTGWFRYAAADPGGCNDTFGTRVPTSGGTGLGSGWTAANYSQSLTGLAPGTTYWFCSIASNSIGTTFGAVLTFTTPPAAPSVTTRVASGMTGATATLNGSSIPNGDASTGWFRYSTASPGTCNDTFGTRAPATGGTSLGGGTAAVPYSQAITGLTAGTTYYVCAIASNSIGTSLGTVVAFTTATPPAVATAAASGVTSAAATLNGSANPDQAATTGWFRYDTVNPGACNDTFGTRAPATGGSSLGSGSTAVPYSQAISGLSPATTYYFCAVAQNSEGTSFGSVLSFTTPTAPAVTTVAASAVASATATLNGSANPNLAATTGWFRYDTADPGNCNDTFGTRAPASGGANLGSGSTAVSYSQAISGLTAGTTYYFCAIASNSVGTSFGAVLTFTTQAAPAVTTLAATGVANSAAVLNGSANPNLAAATGWFRYNTSSPGTCNDTFGTRVPASGGTSLGSGNTAVPWTQTLNALAPATTYYVCAIASNSVGTSFGSVVSFTTTASPITTTVAASGVASTAATLNGSANPRLDSATGWFRYSTLSPGTCNDTFGIRAPASGGSSLGSGSTAVPYSQAISGLAPATTYYFCTIASNSVGTSLGSVLSFTTTAMPAATTSAATSVATTSATLNGTGDPNLDAATGWFRYDTANPGTCDDTFGTRAPATGGTSLGSGTNPISYSQALSGLTPGTTYYFCAIVSNSVGTSFGSVLSFTTLAAPSVTTSAAVGVTSSVATLNGSANPMLSATTGWFRFSAVNPGTCNDTFGTRAPASGGSSLGSGNTAVAYSQPITGLASGITYYFCAIASNAIGTSSGAVTSFTTQSAPSVTTSAASGVASTTATLNGSANPDFAATTGWFRYSTLNPGTCNDTFGTRSPASGGANLGSGSAAVPYSQAISGLAPATTYYYCAIASNSVGTSFGTVMFFTTTAVPTVSTQAATGVASTTATLNGSANPKLAATTGWFRYDTVNPGACNDTFGTRAPATGGTDLGSGGIAVPYSQAVSGLTPGTTYYACAIASNSVGTSVGTVVSFTTTAAPVATTSAATTVASTTATLNGSGDPNLDAATGWFRYDTVNPGTCDDTFGTRAPATGGTSLGSGTTAIAYSQALSGLSPGTTYYFCAIASNSVGTSFGAVLSFTTQAAPSVTTVAASSVASTAATLNGSANPNLAAATGWFRYSAANPGACNDTFGIRAPATGGSSLGSGSTAASYSQALSGLSPATTYYFCAIASNSVGTSFGSVLSFTTTALPAVTTSGATSVASTTATLNGAANPNLAAATGWFRVSTANPGSCNDTFGSRVPAAGGSSLGSGSTAVPYSQPVSGLSPGTTYYFCAIASNSVGTSFGSVLSLTTTAVPTSSTSPATGVASTAATLNGSANPMLDPAIGWFRYDTVNPGFCNDIFGTRVPATGGTDLGSGGTAVAWSQAISGLTAGTTYYFCAFASNSVGATAGTVMSFTTTAAPWATTSAATGVASTAATLNGSANPNLDATTGWFRYSTANPGTCNDTFGTRAPASGGATLGSGNTAVAYTQSISGLAPATTYYFCAVASNSVGTSFGSVLSFTTTALPAVTTSAAALVASTTATVNGSGNPNLAATTGWFRYSTANPGTCNDAFGTRAPASGGTGLGSGNTVVAYSQPISGLAPAATYYFCAIASNSVGTSFGSVMSFTTTALPAVTTSAATLVASTAATLNGAANPNLDPATGWFRYAAFNPGTCNDTFGTRAPASGGSSLGSGNTAVAYAQLISGLAPGTTYYFCAIASNSVGTSVGTVMSFTTTAAPVATTSAASGVASTAATLNGAANPMLDAATGWFRYDTLNPGFCNDTFGIRAPAGGGASLGSGNSAVSFSQPISGLAPGTTYYFCAIASNSVGLSGGAVMSFTTTDLPAVTTSAATLVGSNSAALNGFANPNLAATTGWFRYSTVNPGTCNDTFGTRAPASGGSSLGSGGTSASYSQPVSGVSPGTTYYFCAIASNSVGLSVGSVMSFTTTAQPTAATLAASSVASTSATLGGAANPNLAATTGWFRYGTVEPGTCNDLFGTRAPASGGTSLGSGNTAAGYSQLIAGLSPGTTYYFCAIASNSVGTSFGAVMSFTTTAAPTVTTVDASSVASTAATLDGSANPMLDATTAWFRYGTANPGACNDSFGTRAPASGGSFLGSGNTAAAYSLALSGLSPGTTYYFCAIASNPVGVSFGAVKSFTTTAIPAVTTSAASGVASTAATLNGSANPMLDAATAWFRYGTVNPGTCNDTFGTRAPASGGSSAGSGNSAVSYSQTASGLSPGTTYYFCAIASNSVGVSFGSVMSFTTTAQPAVTTSTATSVLSTTATLHGAANPDLDATTAWFRYDTVDPGTCNDSFGTRAPSSGGTSLGSGSTAISWSQPISGLAPATTYYYCAIASNSVGTSAGAVMSFTTLAAPAVTTDLASGLTGYSATLNGSANPNLDATTGWFRYGTAHPGTCNDSFGTRAPAGGGADLSSGSAAASYSQLISGLTPGTTYYFCAIASNSQGTAFGSVLSFTTPLLPAVTTSAATGVTGTGATLGGSANPNGNATTGWFRYDTVDPVACNDTFGTRAPASSGTDLGSGGTAVPYSETLSGLLPGTTYYFCAIAQSSAAIAFGAVRSFTTIALPVVVTSAPTAVTDTSATLNGSANPMLDATLGWFRYSITNPGTCDDIFGTRAPASGGFGLGAGNSPAAFSQPIAGLSSNTTYYVCAVASNSMGTSFGAVVSFTTGITPPAVTTLAATDVTSTGATLEGSANPNGQTAGGWFRYGTANPGTCDDSFGIKVPAADTLPLGAGTADQGYSAALTGLSPRMTYYFCAAAANAGGATFGSVLSFTTSPGAPTAKTLPAQVTKDAATLNGSANPNGGATTGWFRYDTVSPGTCNDTFGTRAPATGGTAVGSGTQEAPFSQTVSGLAPGTYYYCAIAQSAGGTSFGQVASFEVAQPGCGCGSSSGSAAAWFAMLLAAMAGVRVRGRRWRH